MKMLTAAHLLLHCRMGTDDSVPLGRAESASFTSTTNDEGEAPTPLEATPSQLRADEARKHAPHSTAGEGGVEAPEVMKRWQLAQQSGALEGQVVVLTAISANTPGNEPQCYAGS